MSAVTPLSNARDSSLNSVDSAWPSAARAWYALSLLMVIFILAILDRSVISLLVGPIKSDLRISDTQMSLVMGFAFVTFYMIVGVPIARLTDTRSRRAIIAVGLSVWSIMTALCGVSSTAWHLYAARVGVGVGEACNGPATYSLLADYFPPKKLAKAMSVLIIGYYAGTAVANVVGSRVLKFAVSHPRVNVPVFGTLHPWQLTFLLVGLPGLAVVPLLATLREPRRHGFVPGGAGASTRELVRFLVQNRQAYLPMFGGLGLRLILTVGVTPWLPAFFDRTYGWKPQDSALAISAVQLPLSLIGLVSGGFLAEWLVRRGYEDANMRLNLISTLLILPTSILFPLMPTRAGAIALMGLGSLLAALSAGPTNAAFQIITPNVMRARVTALYLLVFNLMGTGLGPYVIALVTDRVLGNEHAIRYSLAGCAAVFGPVSCLLFWYGLKPYGRCAARAKSWR